VGNRPPSHMQKARASYQVTQLMGRFSSEVSRGVSLQVADVGAASSPPHVKRLERSSAPLLGKESPQLMSQLSCASPKIAPSPGTGRQQSYAATNCRNLPTLTSNLSRTKVSTVAWCAGSALANCGPASGSAPMVNTPPPTFTVSPVCAP